MKELYLKAVACPSQSLVYDNIVFVSAGDAKKLGYAKNEKNYLELECKNNHDNDSIIYSFGINKNIETEQIGMSAIARQACQVNKGDNIKVRKFSVSDQANLNVVFVGLKLKCLTGNIEMDETDVAETIKTKLKDEVLSLGAMFLFDAAGMGSFYAAVDVLKVADPKAENDKDLLITVNRGKVSHLAYFELSSVSKNLRLLRSSNSSQPLTLFGPEWKYSEMGIGGLDVEFTSIFRRAFVSRTLPGAVRKKLGVEHVRGLLLFGPPGTGKTLIARQIGKVLHGVEPKVVNGPEILNKYIGQSEENIRKLFADAETEYSEKGEDSNLHIIIFDEIDAICKQRGTATGSTGVHDTVVNQLLSKMDGVDSLNNILVIGITNRLDMIDTALLRPGRFEVHVEIGLPDTKGRLEILKIHTKTMRENGFLGEDVDFEELTEKTKNFSGAELAGLIKSATSFACYGSLDIQNESVAVEKPNDIKVDRKAFLEALKEVKPAFGASEDQIGLAMINGIIPYGKAFLQLQKSCEEMISQLSSSSETSLRTILLQGMPGTGKTALAAALAKQSGFPFTKIVSSEEFVGWDDASKCFRIRREFEDAHKSPHSIIVIDEIERLLGYVRIGPRFSNLALQTLLVLLKKRPPIDPKTKHPRKLCIIGTTSNIEVMEEMDLTKAFMYIKTVPGVKFSEVSSVFDHKGLEFEGRTRDFCAKSELESKSVPIKVLLEIIDKGKVSADDNKVCRDKFIEGMREFGVLSNWTADGLKLSTNDELGENRWD